MNIFRADLHCHTSCSDGTFSPSELIQHAHKLGLQGLSITDHDTIEAYKTAIPLAEQLGISLIPGIEFSTFYENLSVHILGYAFELYHPMISALCKKHADRRQERNRSILNNLNKLNLPIDEADLVATFEKPLQFLGRPHIAHCMLKKGYVVSIQEAFFRYLGEGCLAYAIGQNITIDETLSAIHAAGGVAIIAHPHLVSPTSLLNALLEMPFDGIECFYGRFTATQCKRWVKIAKRKQWLMSGGSDFHGTLKPFIELGCSYVDEEVFKKLLEHKKT